MKRLVIADIHSNNNRGICTGHYFAVADMYRDLFSHADEVKVASGPIYKSHFDEGQMVLLPYDMDAQGNYIISRIKALLNARSLFTKCRKDTIVLQDGRSLTNHLGILLFCRPKTDLYLIKYTNKGLDTWFEKIVYKLIKRRIKGVICPNETVGAVFDRPYCVVPDYIFTSDSLSRQLVAYNDKKYDFCIVGRLNSDKGVLDTAEFFRGKSYSVLIAGQAPVDYGEKLKEVCQGYGNIDLRLGYVSDADYNRYISESRYCVLNYQGEYSNRSSGVVYDIVFSGVPVLGRRCKALDFVEEYELGVLYHSFDDVDIESIMAEDVHNHFIHNTSRYLNVHKEHRMRLLNFIEL